MHLPDAITSLGDNPYFGAGFGLFSLGMVATIARKGAVVSTQVLRRYMMTTLEIPVSDHSYNWMLQWIARRPDMSCHLSVQTQFQKLHSGKVNTGFNFTPCPGTHYIWYRRLPIKIERVREKQMIDQNHHVPYETVTLTTLGRNKALFNQILYEAREDALLLNENMTLIFKPIGIEWRQFGNPQRRRPLSSVKLRQGQSEAILQDVNKFLRSQQWYVDRGIPHRRGYLLHGPPGCGKTSFITALAGELEYSISVLNVGDWTLSDDRLLHFIVSAPPQSIILLEDIDAAFVDRSTPDKRYEGMNHVTLSGLLNALDGVVSSDGRIVFMTTNHIERLDAALLRPGRVDVKELIDYATSDQAVQAFKHFYPDSKPETVAKFAENFSKCEGNMSMAQVQAYFMRYRNDDFTATEKVSLIKSL